MNISSNIKKICFVLLLLIFCILNSSFRTLGEEKSNELFDLASFHLPATLFSFTERLAMPPNPFLPLVIAQPLAPTPTPPTPTTPTPTTPAAPAEEEAVEEEEEIIIEEEVIDPPRYQLIGIAGVEGSRWAILQGYGTSQMVSVNTVLNDWQVKAIESQSLILKHIDSGTSYSFLLGGGVVDYSP